MQFVKGGPDIDERLLQAHEDGRVALLDRLRTDYDLKQSLLALRLKKPEHSETLNTPLPALFKKFTAAGSPKDNSAVQRQRVEFEKKQSSLQSANSEFLPNFYLAVQKNDVIDPVTETRFVAYVGGLTWKLSTGSYYERKAAISEIAATQSLMDYEKQNAQIDLTTMIGDLNSIIAELKNQEAIVKSLSGILNQSLAQYEAGSISLTSYYDDFRTLSSAEDMLLNNRFKAVDLYAKLAQFLEEDAVFYNGLVF